MLKQQLIIITALLVLFSAVNAVPPCPGKISGINEMKSFPSEIFPRSDLPGERELPENFLILRVDFADVQFDLEPDYPDFLAHDLQYFERLMFHVASYFRDVSHGQYDLQPANFHFPEQIITLPQNMGYYGNDEEWSERIAEFAVDIVEMIDDSIDFTEFDAIVIIHAGAGQESDVNDGNEDALWSTFLTRRSLQAGLDPENDDFPGILCDDGIYLKEFVICPESEWHPYMTEDDTVYGILGVYCHQIGHQIGLPTLFDNNSSNGASFGIGNFGLMGTGVWNANGFVPPLPCAWSRYYLGWEDNYLISLQEDHNDLELTYPTADTDQIAQLYQIKISDAEYFLLENRQQNPDGSFAGGEPSFTFQLLPEGEQEVYPPGHPNEGQPKFNFMENTYEGCEWDFYLPGLGGPDIPVVDGSGILIWHIDENIIAENFDPDFENNSINANAEHKGVDLEEADGIQHLDINTSIYSLGSPYDAYREGNNSYFGKMYLDDELHLPSSDSYYGGNQLEIFNISASDSLMTFSVKYDWNLSTGYTGVNNYPACLIDFTDDGEHELIYPMPNGELYVWKDLELMGGFPVQTDSIDAIYAYDEENNSLLIPTKPASNAYAGLFVLNREEQYNIFPPYFNRNWAAGPVINKNNSDQARVFLPLNRSDQPGSEIIILDRYYEILLTFAFDKEIISNLILNNHNIMWIDSDYQLNDLDVSSFETELYPLQYDFNESSIVNIALVDLNSDLINELLVLTDKEICLFGLNGILSDGFPAALPLNNVSLPSLADLDGNGKSEILIGGENNIAIVDYQGSVSLASQAIEFPDSSFIAAGIVAVDFDQDEQPELIGSFSRNRLVIWENINNNDFEVNRNYPVLYGQRSRVFPLISINDNTVYLPSDNGMIYRQQFSQDLHPIGWCLEYADLQRNSSYLGNVPENKLLTEKTFINEHTYIYPNPLSAVFNSTIFNGRIYEDALSLKMMISEQAMVEIKIFDIAGNLILSDRRQCEAYQEEVFLIDASEMASGMYFVILKAKGEVKKLKFAIEK